MENVAEIITVTVSLIAIIVTLITAVNATKKDAFANLERVVASLEKRLQTAETDLEKERARNDALEARLKTAENELETERAARKKLEFANDELTRRNVELTEEVDTLRARLDALKKK